MTDSIAIAVPRKGRPLEAVLDRLAAGAGVASLADDISSTLRYEKAVAKGQQESVRDAYERIAAYSEPGDETKPDYTLLRDDRPGLPRRIVFDSVTIPCDGFDLQLVGREEPFRALRKHEFAFGFDSADLVLEEVVELQSEPLHRIGDVNDRIDPHDTDVRVVTGLGDTVYHTLMATPEIAGSEASLDRPFVEGYEGVLCISPRYERLVRAVLGERVTDGISFCYPSDDGSEEAAISDAGIGVYLTVTGSTARDHGLVLGERLFPSETVLMENRSEAATDTEHIRELFAASEIETEIAVVDD